MPPSESGYTANMDAAPETVILQRDRSGLRLVWPSGAERDIDAARLRTACRCADCVRARVDGTIPEPFDDLAIAEIAPIGDYAINIVFTDGHARGIFPWAYLRELAIAADTQPVDHPLASHGSPA
jgi:prepilin-type processing-associated H-X9-DG protein